jgi:death-on-curing protein
MDEPIWISKRGALSAHSQQLALHGGSDGVRDETLLDSALNKLKNVFAYEEDADLFRLAASYAFGIARNHAFVDGNKRTALAVSAGFLARNGWDIDAPKVETYLTFLHLADGSLREQELAIWFAAHAVPL